jgi:hypothetical protein
MALNPLSEVFSQLQRATITDRNVDHTAFIAARGSYGSSRGGRWSWFSWWT